MDRGEPEAVSAEPASAPAPTPVPATPAAAGAGPALGHLGAAVGAESLARLDPGTRAHAVQRLQGRHGNQAVARLVGRQAAAPSAPPAGDAPGGKKAAEGLIVADDADVVEQHQMKRGPFLSEMRNAVKAAAESALSGSGWAPLLRGRAMQELESRMQSYAGLDAAGLEAAIKREVPEAAGASSAAALIAPVAQAVKAEVAEALPQEEPPAAELAGSLLGAVKGLLFKRRRGGSADADDPLSVRARLGAGEALPGGVAARMSSVLGDGFGDVRIHTDPGAARMADSLDARAFTVGSHVAFGDSEYRPGTVTGDALIAHELAHVVQQRSGSAEVAAAHAGVGDAALEADADAVAGDAVAALHAGAPATPSLARLRSGLRLQRCGSKGPKTEKPKNAPEPGTTITGTMNQANSGAAPNSKGVYYWPQFREMCEGKKIPFTWDDTKYRYGWAETELLQKQGKAFTWNLTGKSASAALRAFLGGWTVADCASVASAAYYNAILAQVGDERFDEYFKAGGDNALVIGQYPDELPLRRFLDAPDPRFDGIQEGDWYFFANHPKYKHRHPAGLWQGENAVYLGNDEWAGFGAKHTRKAMEEKIVEEYNGERDSDDNARLSGPDLPFGLKRLPDGSLPRELRMIGEQGPDGDGTIPPEIDLPKLRAAGGGLQGEGWRVNKQTVNRAFPK